jgi:hypothetical protein
MDTNPENPGGASIRVVNQNGFSSIGAFALSFTFADVVWIVVLTVPYLVGL